MSHDLVWQTKPAGFVPDVATEHYTVLQVMGEDNGYVVTYYPTRGRMVEVGQYKVKTAEEGKAHAQTHYDNEIVTRSCHEIPEWKAPDT